MIRLRVWAAAHPMGWFGHAQAAYFFEYDPEWISDKGYVLAPQFPVVGQRYVGDQVKTFFENLLPEGDVLDDIISAIATRGASSFELLGRLGAELPGVLSLLPEDDRPLALQEYKPLGPEELSARLHNRAQTPFLVSNSQGSMSLAGAQDKLGLRFDGKTGKFRDCVGKSPSTHIAKPDTRQLRYQPSAINEYACMKLAAALKLPVPEVWLQRVPEAVYVVERYDRQVFNGKIQSIHQIDGCQLLGHGAGWKYQRTGGLVSLPKLVAAMRGLSLRGSDLLQFQRWVMFNFLIGNADAHAKNVSVLIDDKGYRLAQFYDLLCVKAYGDDGLALFIGHEETFDAVGKHSWEAFCQDCGFGLNATLKELEKMALALPAQWQKTQVRLAKEHKPTEAERELLARMTAVFDAQCAATLLMLGRTDD
ncbi:MAG: HipA domain-containing protein [Rhodoferax sp.]|nr:HipA domain-containing protein [Rhodoferax sp.]